MSGIVVNRFGFKISKCNSQMILRINAYHYHYPQVDGIAKTYHWSFANSWKHTTVFWYLGIYYPVYDNLWHVLLGVQKTKSLKNNPLAVHPADMHAKGCPFRPVALNHSTAPGSFSCRKHNAKSSMACGSSCENAVSFPPKKCLSFNRKHEIILSTASCVWATQISKQTMSDYVYM